MQLSYIPLTPHLTPLTKLKPTSEMRHWKKLKTQPYTQFPSSIACINSNHNTSNLFAIAQGINLTIVNPATKTILKQFNSFTGVLSAVCMRPDASVLACGDQTGRIQIIDTKQKFHLRTFLNHNKKINGLDYSTNELYSCSDDMSIRLFDVSTGQVIHSYQDAHQDYIKCVKSLKDGHVLSASYDHTIKLFDFRVHQAAQMQFNHGEPVESIDVFNSRVSLVGVGGKKICLWDIRSTKPLIQSITTKKLLSDVKIAHHTSRILTTSYDSLLKVYKPDTLEITYQQKLNTPLTCLDITENGFYIALGGEDKKVYLKGKNKQQLEETQEESEKDMDQQLGLWIKSNQQNKISLNNKYFYRGIYQKSTSFDIQFNRKNINKISIYDQLIKKFQYKKALLTSLNKNNYNMFQTLVDQYVQRGCLSKTIKSLSQTQVQSVINYLKKLIHNIKYVNTVILILTYLLEHHQTANVNWNQLTSELEKQKNDIEELWHLDGMLELIEYSYAQ